MSTGVPSTTSSPSPSIRVETWVSVVTIGLGTFASGFSPNAPVAVTTEAASPVGGQPAAPGAGVVAHAVSEASRPTVTTYLDRDEYDLLAKLPAQSLRKRRYPVGADFGIDLFEGALAGLELAEIEQDDAAALMSIVSPEWAIAEVTYDPRFQGGRLSLLDAAGVTRLIASNIE